MVEAKISDMKYKISDLEAKIIDLNVGITNLVSKIVDLNVGVEWQVEHGSESGRRRRRG